MSDNNNNAYLHHLYSEQYAEDLERAGRAVFTADVAAMFAGLAAFSSAEAGRQSPKRHAGRIGGAKTFKRQRLDIVDHFNRMDPRLFRRKYRMIKTSFYTLLDILDPYLPSTGEDRSIRNRYSNTPHSRYHIALSLHMLLIVISIGTRVAACGCGRWSAMRACALILQ